MNSGGSDLVDNTIKIASGFGGFGGGIVFVRWLINWLTGRHDLKEAQLETKDTALDERWAKYTRKIEERCEKLETRIDRQDEELEECHRSKRELEARVARLEGFDHGMGERRQGEQRQASLDNHIQRKLGEGR